MKSLSAPELAALQTSPLPVALLVEMDLSTPLFLCSAGINLDIGGNTYLGTKGLGKVDAIQTTPAEIKNLKFEMTGVQSANIALVLTEQVQGKAARVKLALFDPSTYAVLRVDQLWAGNLDTLISKDGQTNSAIEVTAEHAGMDLLRPTVSLWSDSEQRRLYSNDPSLQFVADQAEMRVVWPAASWGRQ